MRSGEHASQRAYAFLSILYVLPVFFSGVTDATQLAGVLIDRRQRNRLDAQWFCDSHIHATLKGTEILHLIIDSLEGLPSGR
jgi:hypothetical protein